MDFSHFRCSLCHAYTGNIAATVYGLGYGCEPKAKNKSLSMKFKFCCHHNIVIRPRLFVYLDTSIIILPLSCPILIMALYNAQSSIVHYNLGPYYVIRAYILRILIIYMYYHICPELLLYRCSTWTINARTANCVKWNLSSRTKYQWNGISIIVLPFHYNTSVANGHP